MTANAQPYVRDLLASVTRVRPLAEAHARDAERSRTLHPAVVASMRDEGLFRIAAPRALGGLEADVATQLAVYEAVAHADPSAGWCLMIGALTTAMMGAYLPDEGAARAFAGRVPITAGLHMPSGVARPSRDGFVVDGRWAFGSGVRHSEWVFTAARVDGSTALPPPMVLVAIPTEQLIVESTWDAVGLRGSGSEHYRAEGVRVDASMSCAYPSAAPRRGGPLFALPFLAFVTVGHVGFALGAAQRALDEIARAAPSRVRIWTQTRLADGSAFKVGLGRAFTALSSARAWSREVLGEMEARVVAGGEVDSTLWAKVRALTAHVTDVAADVAGFAYRAAGAAVLDAANPIQRCWRDLHAATQHIAAADDAYDYTAMVLLGAPPAHPLLAPRAVA